MVTLQKIKKDIENIFEVEDIAVKTRKPDMVILRFMYMVLADKFTRKTQNEIVEPINIRRCMVSYAKQQLPIFFMYEKKHKKVYDKLIEEYSEMSDLDRTNTTLTDYIQAAEKLIRESKFVNLLENDIDDVEKDEKTVELLIRMNEIRDRVKM